MIYGVSHFAFFLLLTATLILAYGLGIVAGRYKKPVGKGEGLLVEGTLLSLLIGFTFGMAQNNFQKRRELIDQEINDFSSVASFIQLYPDSLATPLQQQLQEVLRLRVAYYQAGTDTVLINTNLAHTDSLSRRISARVTHIARQPAFQANNLIMMPALNKLFDGYASSELYRTAKVPMGVFRMLFLLSIVVSFVNGFNLSGQRSNWVMVSGFALLISMTFFMILDLGDARVGNINLQREIRLLEQQSLNSLTVP